MPIYQFNCPNCGPYEVIRNVSALSDTDLHSCFGFIGTCTANFCLVAPAIEALENARAQSYHPLTGERLEHGFYNHFLDGPRGDGWFPDRVAYRKWLKEKGLEER